MPACRDMTRRQFEAALKRNGFRPYWGPYFHCDELPAWSFPGIVYRRRGKYRLARRATIAHLIHSRDAALAAKERP